MSAANSYCLLLLLAAACLTLPPSQVVQLFDDILLLTDGHVVYQYIHIATCLSALHVAGWLLAASAE